MTAVQSLRSKALLSQIEGDRCAVSPLLTVSKESPGCPGCLGSVLTPTRQYWELPAGSFPRSPCPSSQPLPLLSLLGGRVLWQSPPSTWRASAL